VAEQQDQPSKVQSWAYPFPLKNAQTSAAPEDYLVALASADDGFYPLGANGLWHGGIHFSQSTSGKFDQAGGVRCIADGEVVAYRLDSKLLELAYPDGSKAGYSSGFTLVRHRLVLPPVPPSTPAAPGNTAPPPTTNPQTTGASNPQDVLTFFSLYMHTLAWAGYKADPQQHTAEKTLPAYYGATKLYVVGTKSTDPQLSSPGHDASDQPGLRIRSTHSANGEILGWLPRGTKVKIATTHGKWGKISSVVEGAVQSYHAGQSPSTGASVGWVFLPEMDSESKPSALDQIYILPTPKKIAAGELVAYLGEYQRLVEARAHGQLQPVAGERPLLHLEVFTGEDINAFIARSRERAQHLPAKDRTLLLISKGAKLALPRVEDSSIDAGVNIKPTADSPSEGVWCKVQQVSSPAHPHPPSTLLWIKRSDLSATGTRSAWTSFPLSLESPTGPTTNYQRVVSIASKQRCSDGAGNTWYAAQAADENDAAADGWACDHGHALVELKSMWDWPGFDVLDHTASVSEMFQRALFIADHGTPDEIATFQTSFDSARSDAVLKKLEDAIDGQEQRDGKITSHELQLALSKPWLSDRIDHLIVRYESEWGGAMSKWEALNPQMHAGLPVWQAEMKRIEQLRFWEGVNSVQTFPSSVSVYHVHPLGLIGNFISRGAGLTCRHCGADLTMTPRVLTTLYPQITPTNATNYSSSLNKAFKKYELNSCFRVAHFLGQAFVECSGFTSFSEGLTYTNGPRLWGLYHSALVAGLHRLHPDWTEAQMRTYTEANLIHNDPGLGKVLFGSAQYPDVDYRGRGPLNLTLEDNYSHYKMASGVDVIANPNQIATDSDVGCDSSAWFWKKNGINEKADRNSLTAVTHTVNTPMLNIAERGRAAKKALALLNGGANPCADQWNETLTAANGWS
jgi:predicted chitinase